MLFRSYEKRRKILSSGVEAAWKIIDLLVRKNTRKIINENMNAR